MSNDVRELPLTCRACGSDRIVPVIYGMPATDGLEAAERGDIVLGGCMVTPESPSHQCADCRADLGRVGVR